MYPMKSYRLPIFSERTRDNISRVVYHCLFTLVLHFDFRQVLIGLNMTVDKLPGLRGTCGRQSRFPEMCAGFPSPFSAAVRKKLGSLFAGYA